MIRFAVLEMALVAACASAPSNIRIGANGAVVARRVAVAADNTDASRIGAEIFAMGGSVIDAAIATAFALGVVQPESSGIGGGGFILCHRANGKVQAIDFREVAPARAHRDMYLRGGAPVARASVDGPLAVGVPGEVAGLYDAHGRCGGKLPWRELVLPAARLAARGFRVSASFADAFARFAEPAFLARWPAFRREFVRADGSAYRAGDVMRRPALARTLERIAAEGRDGFYRGDVGRAIVAAAGIGAGGILTDVDLSTFAPKSRSPVGARYRGLFVWGMPPPSSGGVVLIEALALFENFNLRKLLTTNAYHHLLTQALIFGFADRANRLGDADGGGLNWEILTDRAHAEKLRVAFNPAQKTPHPDWPLPKVRPRDDGGTTHLSVIDADGNAVALTTTVNTTFGSKVVVPGTGILLNNQMDDFSIQPGVPNEYGLVGGEANAVKAGRRPLSSMSPTIVEDRGRAVLALGGAGGPRIISATLQALVNVVDFGWSIARAVAAPRLHHQWVPDTVGLETGLGDDVVKALTSRGHRALREDFFGVVQIVARRADGTVEAASDPRKGGQPAGW